jgi:hypothetical protein
MADDLLINAHELGRETMQYVHGHKLVSQLAGVTRPARARPR